MREHCPWHRDGTPSLVQYKDGWKCFGCGKKASHSEVEEALNKKIEYEPEIVEKEDLNETFRYINSLRPIRIRGLEFPANDRGYFIVWPDGTYYKYRVFNPGKGGKYVSPKGHRYSLFWALKKGSKTLYITEGEINSLSMAQAFPEADHCSPGSATNFNADNLARYLTAFKSYSNVIVTLDNDAAGTKGLIEAKAFFLYKIPFISFVQFSPDANEILSEKGKEALRDKLQGADHR